MHMADALISPAVGGTLWAISGGILAFCARKVKQALRDDLVPLMGVLGAFIFAAQMINFSIPGTGSSGHLVGGLILSVLLGPYAAFLVIASVLTVQAFFFADGGLLSLGCNMMNMGFFPIFVGYPLIYRVLARGQYDTLRAWLAAIIASVVSLQLGAFSVTLETTASGISQLSFANFLWMMLPIHLAIGVVEGLATAAVVLFVARARPEVLATSQARRTTSNLRPILMGLLVSAILLGGVVSWFASTHPDGLEWSIANITGSPELSEAQTAVHSELASLQEKTAILPDYDFKASATPTTPPSNTGSAVNLGTSVSGIVGGLITLTLAGLVGLALRSRSVKNAQENG